MPNLVGETEMTEVIIQNELPPLENSSKNWIGRNVHHCCPQGNYPTEKYLKLQLLLSITGALSLGILICGAFWENSMDTSQKIIVGSIGSLGTIVSVSCYAANYVIFNNRSGS